MEQAKMDEVKAAIAEEGTLPVVAGESSAPPVEEPKVEPQVEVKPEEKPSTPEQPVVQGVPQSRVDQIVAEREQVKAEKALLQEQLKDQQELEKLGYSIKDIKNYISTAGNSNELDAVKSKREYTEIKQQVSNLTAQNELNAYLVANPTAKANSKVLTELKRANPGKSFEQLNAEFSLSVQKVEKVVVETGRSSSEDEQSTSKEKFGKLTLAEQKAHLDKQGGTFPTGGRL